MTKLLAHYDAKIKAFVPDEAVDLPDGAAATLRVVDEPELPPFPENAGVFYTGGPGLSVGEFLRRLDELDGPIFTDKEPDAVKLVRRWRDQPR